MARRNRVNGREAWWALLFIAPMSVGFLIFFIGPMFFTVYLSFMKTGVFGGATFAGLRNYADVLTSPEVRHALLNTLVYTGFILASLPLALVIAAMLNTRGLRLVGVLRVAYFLPIVTVPVAVAWVWKLLYNGNNGVLNSLLNAVGLPSQFWLSDPNTALIAISLVGVWMSIGYPIVLFLAALQNVPPDLIEAAELDGAGPARRFANVVIPAVSPTIFFVIVLTVIGALQMFDLVYIMIGTNSPILQQTQTIILLFYSTAFVQNNRGMGAAIVVFLMIVIIALTLVQFRLQRRWVHYE